MKSAYCVSSLFLATSLLATLAFADDFDKPGSKGKKPDSFETLPSVTVTVDGKVGQIVEGSETKVKCYKTLDLHATVKQSGPKVPSCSSIGKDNYLPLYKAASAIANMKADRVLCEPVGEQKCPRQVVESFRRWSCQSPEKEATVHIVKQVRCGDRSSPRPPIEGVFEETTFRSKEGVEGKLDPLKVDDDSHLDVSPGRLIGKSCGSGRLMGGTYNHIARGSCKRLGSLRKFHNDALRRFEDVSLVPLTCPKQCKISVETAWSEWHCEDFEPGLVRTKSLVTIQAAFKVRCLKPN